MSGIKGLRTLVTGGAGFIGSHLVDALIQEGCFVRVLDNLSNGKLENLSQHNNDPYLEFIEGSVTEPSDATKAVEDIDIIFHLACLGVRHSIKYPFENHRVNAEGTLTILQEARNANIKKFIYCSSSEIYGTAQYVPMPETHPTYPATVYGASKLAGEAYTRAYYDTYGLDVTIIRPFNTYGPRSHHEGDSGEMIPKSIVRALNNEPIYIFGDGSQTRDFTYVEDTAKGFIAAAKSDTIVGQTLNIGSNFEISIRKIADLILKNLKLPSNQINYVQNRPGDVLRLYADSNKFMEITNWKPQVEFENGLKKTIDWFKSRPEGVSELLLQEKAINWE